MTESHKTFEELGIKIGPDMIADFHSAHGRYPVFEPITPTRLPTRYTTPTGEQKYHMKTTYRPGNALHFKGTEPGKRDAKAMNIVLRHPTDSDSEIILTPENLAKKLHIRMGSEATADATLIDPLATMPIKPTYGEGTKKILEKRKREAAIRI